MPRAKHHLHIHGGYVTSEPDPHGATRPLWRATVLATGVRSGREYVGTGEGKASQVAMARACASLGDQLRETGDHR